MSPLAKRIIVFFMLWVFLVMIVLQVYDNVTGKGIPVRSVPTPAVGPGGTPAATADRLADLQGCVAANPSDLDCTMQLGALYYEAQQWPQAQTTYERAAKLDPRSVEALTKLAGTYIHLSKFEQAASALDQARTLQPDSPEVNLLLGLAYSKLAPPRNSDALVAWRKVLEVAPGSTWADQAAAFIKGMAP